MLHTSACILFILCRLWFAQTSQIYSSVPWNYFHTTLTLGAVDTVGGKGKKKHLDGGWRCFGSFVAAMNKKLLLEVVLHSATISPPVKTKPRLLHSCKVLLHHEAADWKSLNRYWTSTSPSLALWSVILPGPYCTSSHWLWVWASVALFSSPPPPLRASYLCPYLTASLSSQLIYSHHSNLQIIIGEWKRVYKVKCTSDPL